uniref:Secretogranin-3 n=1 Tax=Salarias fasciatus TaxID=181472 RepID=A0A672GIN3_SALFA
FVFTDKTVHNRQLTEERPLQEQVNSSFCIKQSPASKGVEPEQEQEQDRDDFTMLKSLADGQKPKETADVSVKKEDQYVTDESDSTKSRRLAEDYDSTKNGMDYGKYQDDPESFRQVDGTPLTAEDIVQKIANKIYEEDDRGVFDRIVSKLLKLGLITDSQADTLEYQVAEALQDLITKNAKINEVEDVESNDQETRRDQDDQGSDTTSEEDEDDDEIEDEIERDEGNEVSPEDGLQDLQYFPNFYRLLRSLDSEKDTQERETLITIMKTLIDFVKMMVKYGTITPEEGVSYLEVLPSLNDDNTKAEAAKMQKEYENLKDSTKEEQPPTETNHPGKSETYLEAIRKNIEWLKKHNKDEGNNDYDLSKLKDFMDQQVDSYIEKGIIAKDEGDTIKRIYSSL